MGVFRFLPLTPLMMQLCTRSSNVNDWSETTFT